MNVDLVQELEDEILQINDAEEHRSHFLGE